ncbi:hypothetical protein HanXRQr2_Chr16g0751201 [Helianthus annuus]|uniref:Uncharacterized protein n=1 Tax=Helianthus annuus TaxID=4232 RepID=A0A9K3DTQ0_HELAN|nr:hypothetical protein HanXRQr2_Chr16g0751201 [Helianthus annuus]KAJ0821412.1 hypothetical protein HanPSC8_Chr16g0719881 [Helianthus annuus]
MSQFAIPVSLFTMLCEIKIPFVNALHSCITTSGKSPQDVEGGD